MTDPYAETTEFPRVEEQPQPDSGKRQGVRGVWMSAGILIGLVVLALGLGVAVYNLVLHPTSGHEDAPAAGMTSEAQAPATSTVVITEAPSEPATTEPQETTAAPAATSETQAPSTEAAAETEQNYVEYCGVRNGQAVYRDSDVTSCEFALEIGNKFHMKPGHQSVRSPVTGQTYRVNCAEMKGKTFPVALRCTGGNNAVVVLEKDDAH